MSEAILLIGPMAAGKSSVGECLANILNYEQRSLDSTQRKYFKEHSYDDTHADRLRQTNVAKFRLYREQFYIHAIEGELSQHKYSVVFDFGAPQSVYSNPKNLDRVKKFLDPYSWVILLLPSADIEKSRHELLQRKIKHYAKIGQQLDEKWFLETNDYYLKNPSNQALAKQNIYTAGKLTQVVCNEILRLVSG